MKRVKVPKIYFFRVDRIRFDVIRFVLQIGLVADDVFVIISLPEFRNRACIIEQIHFFRGLIFEICNNLSQRGLPAQDFR